MKLSYEDWIGYTKLDRIYKVFYTKANGMMESFFGILKSEMFYGFERLYQSLDELEQAITDYMFYYNNKNESKQI